MTRMNKNKKIATAFIVGLILVGAVAFLFARNGKKEEKNPEMPNSGNTSVQNTNSSDSGTNQQPVNDKKNYTSDKAKISFEYPKTYSVIQDELGSGQVNAKLILRGEDGTMITFYENLHGLIPQYADFIYHMKKSDGVFIVDERLEGEVPERDTESFSIIANFGDAEGTSKINGKSWLVILNSKPSNTHEAEFKSILSTIKEI